MVSKRDAWQPIETAPKDGTRFRGRMLYTPRFGGARYRIRRTWWGKCSHVPLHGWCWGRGPESIDLWRPTHWMPESTRPGIGMQVCAALLILFVAALVVMP